MSGNISRILEKSLSDALFKGKTVILYGPRQVGKTTLVKKILAATGKKTAYFDAESLATRQLFSVRDPESARKSVLGFDVVVLDEAQKIPNVGSLLKWLHDHTPQTQIIATGSSSFDLAQKTRESMAGRTKEFFLGPILLRELLDHYGHAWVVQHRDALLRYGTYPLAVAGDSSDVVIQDDLTTLAGALLSKDLLSLEGVRKAPLMTDLLTLVALQVGNEVSYTELAQKLGVNIATVQRYLYLLEEAFIIFTLRALSRNARNEVRRSQKIYFYDVGVRNALIRNFNSLSLRTDVGALWENFAVAERVKFNRGTKTLVSSYFWRTKDRKEIDYVEESGGKMSAFEMKWNPRKGTKLPAVFSQAYPSATWSVVSPATWIETLGR